MNDYREQVTFRPYQAGDETQINDGFNKIFGLHRPLEEWHWKFQPNRNDCWIMLAVDDHDDIIAHYAVIRQKLQVRGKLYTAGQPVDVYRLRRPGFDKKGIFPKTVQTFFDTYCSAKTIQFMFGFPGEDALRVGQRYNDYGDEVRIRLWQKPTSSKRRFQIPLSWRKIKPVRLTNDVIDHDEANKLWQRAMPRYWASLVRDANWLKRRYSSRPSTEYYLVPIKNGTTWHAWAVLKFVEQKIKMIDLLWDGEDQSSLEKLEFLVMQFAQSMHATHVEMWLSGDPLAEDVFQQRGWQSDEHPLLLYLVGKSWHPELNSMAIIERLYLTMGDTDLY